MPSTVVKFINNLGLQSQYQGKLGTSRYIIKGKEKENTRIEYKILTESQQLLVQDSHTIYSTNSRMIFRKIKLV